MGSWSRTDLSRSPCSQNSAATIRATLRGRGNRRWDEMRWDMRQMWDQWIDMRGPKEFSIKSSDCYLWAMTKQFVCFYEWSHFKANSFCFCTENSSIHLIMIHVSLWRCIWCRCLSPNAYLTLHFPRFGDGWQITSCHHHGPKDMRTKTLLFLILILFLIHILRFHYDLIHYFKLNVLFIAILYYPIFCLTLALLFLFLLVLWLFKPCKAPWDFFVF